MPVQENLSKEEIQWKAVEEMLVKTVTEGPL